LGSVFLKLDSATEDELSNYIVRNVMQSTMIYNTNEDILF